MGVSGDASHPPVLVLALWLLCCIACARCSCYLLSNCLLRQGPQRLQAALWNLYPVGSCMRCQHLRTAQLMSYGAARLQLVLQVHTSACLH